MSALPSAAPATTAPTDGTDAGGCDYAPSCKAVRRVVPEPPSPRDMPTVGSGPTPINSNANLRRRPLPLPPAATAASAAASSRPLERLATGREFAPIDPVTARKSSSEQIFDGPPRPAYQPVSITRTQGGEDPSSQASESDGTHSLCRPPPYYVKPQPSRKLKPLGEDIVEDYQQLQCGLGLFVGPSRRRAGSPRGVRFGAQKNSSPNQFSGRVKTEWKSGE
eukprot:GHVT01062005.1.p2 GENE.GHVT01062005.1~~GHVT01062005.1.p2  ORF type:complete len:222 (-),score=46.39 GHVT01062005.1:981-1646(-)